MTIGLIEYDYNAKTVFNSDNENMVNLVFIVNS